MSQIPRSMPISANPADTGRYPAERTIYADPQTGARVIQWTAGSYNSQHLYFTTFSVTADDRWLVFLSDRDGNPNLYSVDRRTGVIQKLSRNRSGLLRSYVYPQGGLVGLSKASPALDPDHNRLYYIRDDAIFGVSLDDPAAGETKIWSLPPHWFSAYPHLSPDGRTLCLPCADPSAFIDQAGSQWDQMRSVPVRMKERGLCSRIYLVDLHTGQARIAAEVPFWVTHVQFDPAGSGRIIFNQEGFVPGTCTPLPDRIWRLEPSGAFSPLAPEDPGEWRTHENWSPSGDYILYHGSRSGHTFIAMRTWEGQLIREISTAGIACYHATPTRDGRRLLIDGHDGCIASLEIGTSGTKVTPLCRHNTSMKDQDTHAHPFTTPRGESLIFTSDRTGHCNVYEVALASN